MPDLKIGATVDLSAANAALQQGQVSVQTYCDQMNVSFQTVSTSSQRFSAGTRSAFKSLSDDVKAAADAVGDGSVRVAQATQANVAAQLQLRAASRFAKDDTVDQAAATKLLAAAQENARRTALELASAQSALSGASQHAVTDVQATSGVIRSLEGNGGIRAVERFVATTLGLGGAMQALFPIIGAAGLAGLVFKLGEEFVDMYQKGIHAGEETARSFGELTGHIRTTDDEIKLANSHLQDQIDKLSGTPNNGLETSLLRDAVAADKLQESLAGVIEKIQEKNKANAVGLVQSAVTGSAYTGGTDKEIDLYLQGVEEKTQAQKESYSQREATAKAAHDREAAESRGNTERLKAIDDAFYAQQQVAARESQGAIDRILAEGRAHLLQRAGQVQQKQDGPAGLINGSQRTAMEDFLGTTDFSDQINRFKGAANVLGVQRDVNADTGIGQQKDAQKGALEQQKELAAEAKKGDEAARKAAEERFKGYETERQQEIEAGKLGAAAELSFWQSKADAFQRGSDQYRAVRTKIQAAQREVGRSNEEYGAEQTRGAEIRAKETEALALANIQYDLASGKINKVTADQRIATIQAQEYADKLAALQQRLAAINADTSLSPEDRRNKGQGVQNQIDETQGQAAAALVQERARAAQASQEAKQKEAEAQERLNVALIKGEEVEQQNAFALAAARIASAEQSGAITKLAGDQETAALHTAEHTARLKELQQELEALREQAKSLPPGGPAATDNAAKQVGVENQISQEQGKGQTQSFQDAATIQQQASQPMVNAFNAIQSSWMSTQRSILTGQTTVANGFKRMASQMALDVVQGFEKMLFSSLTYEVRTLAAHTSGNAAKTGSDVTAATVGSTVKRQSALQEIFIDAKSAAAGAFKALAGIPIVGPVLAPIGAGTAFAGVMALAAFETGGVVDGQMGIPQVILAHGGERVLSASQTQNFEKMVNTSDGGGDLHLHMGGNTFQGGAAADPFGDFDKHVHQSMKRLHRDGKLAFAKRSQ